MTQAWDELVVADDTRDQIRALVARVRHAHHVLEGWGYRQKLARGAGVAALFSGLPGTGKTMVAGLIARELDLERLAHDFPKMSGANIRNASLAAAFLAAADEARAIDQGHLARAARVEYRSMGHVLAERPQR